jgi:hypothetical protein
MIGGVYWYRFCIGVPRESQEARRRVNHNSDGLEPKTRNMLYKLLTLRFCGSLSTSYALLTFGGNDVSAIHHNDMI